MTVTGNNSQLLCISSWAATCAVRDSVVSVSQRNFQATDKAFAGRTACFLVRRMQPPSRLDQATLVTKQLGNIDIPLVYRLPALKTRSLPLSRRVLSGAAST